MIGLYEYIIGRVVNIKDGYVVLDNNGIGYRIFTSTNSLMNLEVGEEVTMYIYFNMRDDGISLYGFKTEEELDIFNMLLLVSRVGPKVGLGVLSALTPNQIKLAILNNDPQVLCKAPGIGSKTADRIILELRDRIDKDDIAQDEISIEHTGDIEAAISGMMSLGYTRGEILRVIAKIDIGNMSTEDIMKEALRRLSI